MASRSNIVAQCRVNASGVMDQAEGLYLSLGVMRCQKVLGLCLNISGRVL